MPGLKTNELPGTRAVLRHYRMSAYKARQVLDLIRGKDVDRAEEILRTTPREAARVVNKVLGSAVANARNNDALDPDELYVSACYADEGTTLKRWRPRARGRATRIRKRTCHITVIVSRLPEERLERRRAQQADRSAASRSRRVAASKRAGRTPEVARPSREEEAEAQAPEETELEETQEGAEDYAEEEAEDYSEQDAEGDYEEEGDDLEAQDVEEPEEFDEAEQTEEGEETDEDSLEAEDLEEPEEFDEDEDAEDEEDESAEVLSTADAEAVSELGEEEAEDEAQLSAEEGDEGDLETEDEQPKKSRRPRIGRARKRGEGKD
jgi:large subunit ribosomal protein L22